MWGAGRHPVSVDSCRSTSGRIEGKMGILNNWISEAMPRRNSCFSPQLRPQQLFIYFKELDESLESHFIDKPD